MVSKYFEPQEKEFPYVQKIFIGNKVDAVNMNPANTMVPEQPPPMVKREDARITTKILVQKKEGEIDTSEEEKQKKKGKKEPPTPKKKKKRTPEEKEQDKVKEWKKYYRLYECSALEGNNIKNAWDTLITKILQTKQIIKRKDKVTKKFSCNTF